MDVLVGDLEQVQKEWRAASAVVHGHRGVQQSGRAWTLKGRELQAALGQLTRWEVQLDDLVVLVQALHAGKERDVTLIDRQRVVLLDLQGKLKALLVAFSVA